MVLKDYGHGRPLSAHRSLSVKAAIDSNNAAAVARARELAGTSVFQSQEAGLRRTQATPRLQQLRGFRPGRD